ncbi:MAG: CvpA family protein [Rhodospirillaceae bacterium]|nr:CvpA family protein [Rhodospirillaceae bacterium]
MNWFDLAVLGVVLLSGLLAMARGFVKELLSLAGWIVAAIVTFIALPYLREPVRQFVKSHTIADIGTGIVIFLVVLVICGLATSWLTRRMPGGTFGFLDGILGLVFGLARGALLVSIAYVLLQVAFKEDNLPRWVTEARTREYLDQGANLIRRLNPEDWFERGRKALEDQKKTP